MIIPQCLTPLIVLWYLNGLKQEYLTKSNMWVAWGALNYQFHFITFFFFKIYLYCSESTVFNATICHSLFSFCQARKMCSNTCLKIVQHSSLFMFKTCPRARLKHVTIRVQHTSKALSPLCPCTRSWYYGWYGKQWKATGIYCRHRICLQKAQHAYHSASRSWGHT